MSVPSITNCPNCGAPIDISRSSCEYCGTPYEKSNDIHIEVTAPDQSVEDFAEVLSRISRRNGFNLLDSTTLYANNQAVYSQVRQSIQATQQELLSGIASATAWQPTPEEERKMIEDMRNVAAPMIFPKVEEQVNLIDEIRYERRKELLHDILGFLILLGPAIIAGVITWFLTY